MSGIQILENIDAISRAVTEKWIALSNAAIKDRGEFHVALSGGSTPRNLYQHLAKPENSQQIDWRKTHIYFGDERSVPPDHKDSNFKMAFDALLSKVDVPEENIHRMHAEAEDIMASAAEYERILVNKLPETDSGAVRFDLILLGMGDDGHTASLFPGTPILEEHTRLVSPVYVDKLSTWRMSLTFRAINSARNIAVMIAGEGKKQVLAVVLGKTASAPVYPIQMLQAEGEIDWYIDEKAAGELQR